MGMPVGPAGPGIYAKGLRSSTQTRPTWNQAQQVSSGGMPACCTPHSFRSSEVLQGNIARNTRLTVVDRGERRRQRDSQAETGALTSGKDTDAMASSHWYTLRLGYDPRVFLEDPALRGQQVSKTGNSGQTVSRKAADCRKCIIEGLLSAPQHSMSLVNIGDCIQNELNVMDKMDNFHLIPIASPFLLDGALMQIALKVQHTVSTDYAIVMNISNHWNPMQRFGRAEH